MQRFTSPPGRNNGFSRGGRRRRRVEPMPELPDLEVARRYVNATSLHQNIRSVEVRNEKILGDASARELSSTLEGRSFDSTRRHGKNLFVGLDDGGWMLMHFRMTGNLPYFRSLDDEPPYSRL